ncbi:MAG: N-acetylneuraminate synthase family protein [Alphaproteobacteria bacterium]|jgi:sialic acid synthase SpsE|nr:N-acetylneuraminate synthase family protein [Alphaproteobacteria bacterium]MDP6588524.1 N-acetylneuraminate synthase family protein [Alphaproteobacteria bacterium]MDP6816672.1 N-acetylneuraminate synthase family protein [Alphaproteobacteria bacterium]
MSAVLIIAEAGVNHDGEFDRALALVDAAARAGADIVKFQAFRGRDLVAGGAPTAAYQREKTGHDEQRAMLERLELSLDQLAGIAKHCRARDMEFLCTAFDSTMIAALTDMGMRRIKVASGELDNLPALAHVAASGLPVLLSTGMATLEEVRLAVETLRQGGAGDITLLHCTSLYPAPMESVNLRAMQTLRQHFNLPVGYSDHSLGDHVAVAAVALGASVIEKHLTLDHALAGPDHAASLNPDEFAAMSARLRATEVALGDGVKAPSPAELEVAEVARKSWHAATDLAAGALLAAGDVCLKRPATGLSAAQSPIGHRLKIARAADEPIREVDIMAVERSR